MQRTFDVHIRSLVPLIAPRDLEKELPITDAAAVTVIAGGVWSLIYYRWRSLVPLAVSHALLGTALHFWVFGNDLLERWLP